MGLKLLLFGFLSVPVIIVSWQTLFHAKSHGFYRFFSWECIIWLFVSNYKYWFERPFNLNQIFSWIFLIFSAYLVIAGVIMLKKAGKQGIQRNDEALYKFERTSELIDTGIYAYIRHPLYSSLLFLTWGIFLKHTSIYLFIVALSSSIFLFITALFDEKECVDFFGDKYVQYMKRTKRFIPFMF
jgi:protein-S-isoprenylcysteine O-methyltransferase Ste14